MRWLLLRLARHLLWRQQVSMLRAEQEAWRREAAEHNAAVARILAQAPRPGKPWQSPR